MQAKELETELDAAFIEVEYQISVDSCKDHDVSPWLGLPFMVFTRLKHCNLYVSHCILYVHTFKGFASGSTCIHL